MNKRILVVIPARGGSEEIPKKNMREFCGRPLLYWTIESAKTLWETTKYQNAELVVSSDDDEILDYAYACGAVVVRRPDDISDSKSPVEAAVLHVMEQQSVPVIKYDAVVLLQPTSPMRKPHDLESALNQFFDGGNDSLFSSVPSKDTFIWNRNEKEQMSSLTYDYRHRQNRQDIHGLFTENGSIYIFKPEVLRRCGRRLGGEIGTYVMSPWQEAEMDAEHDWIINGELMHTYLPEVLAKSAEVDNV